MLEAAGSKWNFIPFRPGLVGGHCIGVDPYSLSFKALQAGYYPELISAQRRNNDRVGQFVVEAVVKLMLKKRIHVNGANVLVLGITFKENCLDIRNTKIVDVVAGFEEYRCNVTICNPWAHPNEVMQEYSLSMATNIQQLLPGQYAAVLLAVAHNKFRNMSGSELKNLCAKKSVMYDIKCVLDREVVDSRL